MSDCGQAVDFEPLTCAILLLRSVPPLTPRAVSCNLARARAQAMSLRAATYTPTQAGSGDRYDELYKMLENELMDKLV